MANGAVGDRLNLNLLDPQQAANILPTLQTQFFPGQTQFLNGQFSSVQRLLQQQFVPPAASSTPSPTAPVLFPQEPQQQQPSSLPTALSSLSPTAFGSISNSFFNLNNPNVQFVEDPNAIQNFANSHTLFKRNEDNAKPKRIKVKRIIKRSTVDTKASAKDEKVNKKRALVALSDGSYIDDKNLADAPALLFDGLSQFGASDFQDGLTRQGSIEDEIKEHDRESAEDEVKAVLSLCSACDVEPFIGAVVLSWKDAKIQPEHALKGHSVGSCGEF